MNRRGFLRALVAAPIAAAVAPMALARPATGGVIRSASFASLKSFTPAFGTIGLVGERGPEFVMPTNSARVMQQAFEAVYGVNEAHTAVFDANAAYCDEMVEADIADPSPAA
jgi:phage-related minor tail protein